MWTVQKQTNSGMSISQRSYPPGHEGQTAHSLVFPARDPRQPWQFPDRVAPGSLLAPCSYPGPQSLHLYVVESDVPFDEPVIGRRLPRAFGLATGRERHYHLPRRTKCSNRSQQLHSQVFSHMALHSFLARFFAFWLQALVCTKEALNPRLSLGGLRARDSFQPSCIFGIIKLIRGMAFLIQSVIQSVLHFSVTFKQSFKARDYAIRRWQ